MNLIKTTYKKDFINELASKCYRYRWFLIGAIIITIIAAIGGSFFENRFKWNVGGIQSYEIVQIGSPLAMILPMIIAVALVVLINLPNEQRYQISCAKGRLTPMLVNSTIALIITLLLALITTFVPTFVATCGMLSAISSNGYYDTLIFTSSELLIDFGHYLLISWLVVGSANKFMYYLKANPKLLILWALSAFAVFGIAFLIIQIFENLQIEFDSLNIFIIMVAAGVLYESVNVAIRFLTLRKGDISR